ncbi:MAG: thiolase family protein, partial [Desulfobacula sp.]|nr:thiolase family protein [Desulfobacula sp.]
MNNVYIIGLGMIRFNKYPDRDVRSMAHEVTRSALKDAGIDKKALESAFFSNTFWGFFDNQHSIRGQVVLRSMGIEKIPVTNIENACAGGSTALHMACTSIRAGMHDVVLALGSEKISNPNKAMSLGAYASCMDVGNFKSHLAMLEKINKELTVKIPDDQTPPGKDRSVFMDAYAMGARWHMSRFGS